MDSSWQGNKAAKMTMSNDGASILFTPDGKWTAIVDTHGKTLATCDPPIGLEFPLKVGKSGKAHRLAK